MIKSVIEGFLAGSLYAYLIIVILALPIYWFGQAFETRYWPVVRDYQATPIDSDDEYSWYQVTFEKLRSCAPLNTFEWYLVRPDGSLERVNVAIGNSAPIDRPLGITKILVYRVDNKNHGDYISQKLIMTHDCHWFWITRTEINIPGNQ